MLEPTTTLATRILARAREMRLEDELPRLARLDQARVANIVGGSPFSAAEFEAVCGALAVDPTVMYRGEESQPSRVPARFRAALEVGSPSGMDVRLLALAVEQGRILAHLMASLGRSVGLAGYRSVRALQVGGERWQEGYELGEEARRTLRPAEGPLRDLEGDLRAFGVHVARVTLSTPQIDAAAVWEPGAVPVILLNKASRRHDHPGALRASMAHELCHLLHDAGDRDLTTQVSWGTGDAGNYSASVEVRARAFAPAFLAPRAQVAAWYESLPPRVRRDARRTSRELGEYWGLSFEGAVWHAKNCHLIDADVADRLVQAPGHPRLDLKGFVAAPEWVPLEMLHPDLPLEIAEIWEGFARNIVLDALDEGLLTVGRARELLTWG